MGQLKWNIFVSRCAYSCTDCHAGLPYKLWFHGWANGRIAPARKHARPKSPNFKQRNTTLVHFRAEAQNWSEMYHMWWHQSNISIFGPRLTPRGKPCVSNCISPIIFILIIIFIYDICQYLLETPNGIKLTLKTDSSTQEMCIFNISENLYFDLVFVFIV